MTAAFPAAVCGRVRSGPAARPQAVAAAVQCWVGTKRKGKQSPGRLRWRRFACRYDARLAAVVPVGACSPAVRAACRRAVR